MSTTENKALLKQEFISKRGYWNSFCDGLLDLDPDFFSAYLDYSSIPWRHGTLQPKVKEFIYIAIDAATTHLYKPGLRVHLRNALRYGATSEEIMEVYRLTSSIGAAATMLLGTRILAEELGRPAADAGHAGVIDAVADASKLREAFTAAFGYWDEDCAAWLRLDPLGFASALKAWGDADESPLDPRTTAFVLIAVNAAVTRLDGRAVRAHIRQALKHGAGEREIVEVLQLASVLGMHTYTVGVTTLLEEIARSTGKAGSE